jgi:ubiquinone/menaquinone biosynthesis C-methylase UbiE
MRIRWLVITSSLAAILCIGHAARPQSEEDRAAELKRRVIETLSLRPGQTAAEVGCGDGFYSLPLARFLGPSGKLYAEDISDDELAKLKQNLSAQSLTNVEVLKGAADDPRLPAGRMDAVLIVNAYHEMTEHQAMLRHVNEALKQGGTFVLMEAIWSSRESQSRKEQAQHHQLAPKFARQEVQEAGFDVIELLDPFLERPPDEDGKSRWWLIIARKAQ